MKNWIMIAAIAVLFGLGVFACAPETEAETPAGTAVASGTPVEGSSTGDVSSVEQGEAAKEVEAYLQALMEKNEDALVQMSCPESEMDALLELDAYANVETRLEGAVCQQTGQEGEDAIVNCAGKIIATYGDEDQEFDLTRRRYHVRKAGGELLICGYELLGE